MKKKGHDMISHANASQVCEENMALKRKNGVTFIA